MSPLVKQMRLSRYSGICVFVLFVIVYSIWLPQTFPTTPTLQSVASNQAITGVAALGLVCALSVGAFDLAIANLLGLSSTVAAVLMVQQHVTPAVAVLIVLAMGVIVGLLNGLFIVVFRIPSVVATLGMSSILIAIDDKLTHGQFITPMPSGFSGLSSRSVLGMPILFVVLIAVALVIWYVLEHTPTGRRMIATGAGIDAARLAGTNTGRMVVIGLVISGALGSLAGLMLVSSVGSAAPASGPPYLLALFAAVYLGSTQIKPGRFNVWGTVVALYVLATGVKGLQLAGGQYWVGELFNGVALILAVGIAIFAQDARGLQFIQWRGRRGGRTQSSVDARVKPRSAEPDSAKQPA
jgi:ribose transport system permease protein